MKHTLALALATSFGLFLATAPADARPVFSSSLIQLDPVAIKADIKGAKELWLVARNGGDGDSNDWAVWMEPMLIKADGTKIKLTDLKPKFIKVGWDELGNGTRSNGQEPIKVKGVTVPFAFIAHAPSVLGFDLPEGVVGFEAQGGVNDRTPEGQGGTVKFVVFTKDPGSLAADGNLKGFTTPEGLGVSLFATEPMIQNPTNIDIDPRGRVWATECVNYRKYLGLRPAGDRVVILESTKGDGVADKETVFYQSKELTNPLGICVLPQKKGTKVIVSAAPNVWLLTDKDGDDVAEEAKVIFKVGGEWNYDHQVHSFCFGPDGKFYFNSGNSITELTGPDGKIVRDLAGNEITNKGKPYWQGMVFRCDIDLETAVATNVETLGHNFRNNYEVAVDSFGAMWQSDNDDDGDKGVRINYVMDGGNFGYTDEMTGAGWGTKRTNMEAEIPHRHWHLNDPGVVPNLLQTGAGSPTGILVNEGTELGAAFTNQIIHCDAGPRTVRAYPIQKDGAGYKATMLDILTSDDNSYRPSDAAIAPDGSLFVADWYDTGVGGHGMGDTDPAKMRGRIYRVAVEDSPYEFIAPDFSTAEGCAKALQSPNKVTQYVAWSSLHAMGPKAVPALRGLWKSENPRIRARALGLLAQVKGSEGKHLVAGFADADSDVRCFAVRLLRMMNVSRGFDPGVVENDPAFKKMLRDPSAAVRREIALSLPARKNAQFWAMLAQQHDGKDRWYLEALGIGARGNEEACFDAWLAVVGESWNTAAGRDIVWRMRTAKSASLIVKILADQSVKEVEKPRYLRAFDFLPETPEKTKSLIQIAALSKQSEMSAAEAMLRLKDIDLSSNTEMKAALDAVLAASRGTVRFVELVRQFRLKGQGEGLLEVVTKNPTSPETTEAAKMLMESDSQLLASALSGAQAGPLMEVLGSTGDQRAVALLTPVIADLKRNVADRKIAVNALTKSSGGIAALIQAAKSGSFPEDLKFTATYALAVVQDEKFKNEIAQFFPPANAADGKALPPIAELVKLKGDADRGRTIYEKAESTCIICHRTDNVGVDVGPALSEIGGKLGKEAIYESIIAPNAGISMGFETTQLTLKNGDAALGIIRSEIEDELVIAMPGGAQSRFKKNEIAKREKLATSLMPPNLQKIMPQQDFVDLVEYLASRMKP